MDARQLSCDCDMPIEIYADWLQDQGWDVEEMRQTEEIVTAEAYFTVGSGYATHMNTPSSPHMTGTPSDYDHGVGSARGDGYWFYFDEGCPFPKGRMYITGDAQ